MWGAVEVTWHRAFSPTERARHDLYQCAAASSRRHNWARVMQKTLVQRGLFLFLCLMMSGCVAPQDLASRKPFLVADVTTSPEKTIEACFSDTRTWRRQPFRNGWAVWVQISYDSVFYLANITPTPKGSHVEVFMNKDRERFGEPVAPRPCLTKLG